MVKQRVVSRAVVAGLVLNAVCFTAAHAEQLTSADTNGDGQISRDEAMAAQDDSFQRLDENGDGQLSMDEFNAGQPGLPDGASADAQARRRAVVGRWFDRIDTNDDDRIASDEYRKAVSPYFDRLDRDRDGMISSDEVSASFRQAEQAQEELQSDTESAP